MSRVRTMTLAEIQRMIRAAIRAARKEGAQEVELRIGEDASVRIPLAPKTLDGNELADHAEIIL